MGSGFLRHCAARAHGNDAQEAENFRADVHLSNQFFTD
jgi:hypothetical protein